MFAALVEAIRATVAAAGSERSRLDRWATALRIFNQLVGCLRVFSSRSAVGLCLKVLLVMVLCGSSLPAALRSLRDQEIHLPPALS